jgi:hypothetical protein
MNGLRGFRKRSSTFISKARSSRNDARALARRNRVELAFSTVKEIRDAYRFEKLDDFLAIYNLSRPREIEGVSDYFVGAGSAPVCGWSATPA